MIAKEYLGIVANTILGFRKDAAKGVINRWILIIGEYYNNRKFLQSQVQFQKKELENKGWACRLASILKY